MQVTARRVASLPPTRDFTPLQQSSPSPGIFWRRQGALRSILWGGAALLEVEGGDTLRINTLRNLDGLPAEILNLGVALLLSGRGHQILHAGGLARDRVLAVILGPPGSGKSSLVLAGARRGMHVVSDEIIPFRMRGTSFVCPGSNPVVRIDPRWAPEIVREETRQESRGPAIGARDKVAVDVRHCGWRCAEGASRLALIVLLGPRLGRGAPRYRLERLAPTEALIGLLDNTFNRRVLTAAELRKHLRLCASVAKELPAYRLRVRSGMTNVDAAARGVDQRLARLRTT